MDVSANLHPRLIPALSPPAITRTAMNPLWTPGVQSDPEGSLWRDPPNYWEQIVWPAYVDAHKGIVDGGDVEHGRPNGAVPGLILIDGLEMGMSDIVEKVCARVAEEVECKK